MLDRQREWLEERLAWGGRCFRGCTCCRVCGTQRQVEDDVGPKLGKVGGAILAELHRDWMKAEDLSKVQTKEMSYQ